MSAKTEMINYFVGCQDCEDGDFFILLHKAPDVLYCHLCGQPATFCEFKNIEAMGNKLNPAGNIATHYSEGEKDEKY